MTEPSYTESLELEPIAPNQETNTQMRNCEGIINQFEQSATSNNGETQIQSVIETDLPLPTHQVIALPEATEAQLLSEDRDRKDMQYCGDLNKKLEESETVEGRREEHAQKAMKEEPQLALTEVLDLVELRLRTAQNGADDNQMVIEEREPLAKGTDDKELEKHEDTTEKMKESHGTQERVQEVANEIPSNKIVEGLELEERKLTLKEEEKTETDPLQNMNEKTEESELVRDGQEENLPKNAHDIPPQQNSNRTKEELELREFLLKDENNKEMPCCGDIIEKLGGCNRIECSCGKHVCWVCSEYFDEKDDCYSHLIDVHGGYFEENEIENMIQSGAKKLLCCGNLAFNEGDNHVVCPICRKHSCWLCLEVFTIGRDCDKHLFNAHRDN